MKYMIINSFQTFVGIAILCLVISCKKTGDPEDIDKKDIPYKPVSVTPISGVRIGWDYNSLEQLAERGQAPVMVRQNESNSVVVYEANGEVFLRSSADGGNTWDAPVTLFEKTTHEGKDGSYAITYTDLKKNPSIIQLQSGDLLAACAVYYQYTEPNSNPRLDISYPAGILVKKINGNDLLIGEAKEVFFNLGCDEPAFLQLPNGDIQLYFTNGAVETDLALLSATGLDLSHPTRRIDMISSSDDGDTWSSKVARFGANDVEQRWIGAHTIVSRYNQINSEASAVTINEKIILAFSDNQNVTFKPYTVRTPLTNPWPFAINGDAQERDYALYKLLPDNQLIAGPTLLNLPSGEVLLSYETDFGKASGIRSMGVAVGNADAFDFTNDTHPFGFSDKHMSRQSSLVLWDTDTIAALATSNYILETDSAPYLIKGLIMRDLDLSASEDEPYPLFVGSKSSTQLRAGLMDAGNDLNVRISVADNTPVPPPAGTVAGDGVYVYIDAPNLSLLDVDAGMSKFFISSEGDVIRWDGKEGAWELGSPEGVSADVSADESGYSLMVSIPKNALVNYNAEAIRFAVGFTDYSDETTHLTELLALSEDLKSSTWLGVTF
ncbi:hypothetical protein [Parapedobacter sp. 10938]|uniref:hypothetical protein n=1 Tax=Parapedobacter flavus TaxID=3110225 RepID=UPI002DBDBAB2|nr:hypothetical protein [Parapedobacter sp. 10938]MEC3880507.1 hypothetical protein [Parapedobacter sp. 10938]